MSAWTFTSESVTEGHPDKVADHISDTVLHTILGQDERGKIACETLVKSNLVVVAGEITTTDYSPEAMPGGACRHRIHPHRNGYSC